MKKLHFLLFLGTMILWSGVSATATELVYQPVNPSFGGNPLNGSILMNAAVAQKDIDTGALSSRDPIEDFQNSLARRILNNLANQIVDTAFGGFDADLADGHYEFGDYSIDISGIGGDLVTVSITDIITGGTTTIEVPYY